MVTQHDASVKVTFSAVTPQNGQTHLNNSSADCLTVFDHFVWA